MDIAVRQRRRSFWASWLVTVAGVATAFGAFIALGNQTPAFDVIDGWFNTPFWGDVDPDAMVADFQSWAYSVMGAAMLGLAVLIGGVAHVAIRRGERWGWWTVAGAIGGWYALDTGASALGGVWPNVVFNSVFFLAIVVPLWFTRKALD
ncbi:MAG: hypothetical protein JW722_00240 [Demequinaceae bacterium]|nr:hypothetical protein [Demequinaceae bacterium]